MRRHAPFHPRLFTITGVIWCAVGLLWALNGAMMFLTGMTIHAPWPPEVFWLMGACAALCLTYRFHRDDNLCLFGHAVNQTLLNGLGFVVFTYLTARLNRPLIDAELIRMDLWMGFDWRHYAAWAESHPSFAAVLNAAYLSTSIQYVVLFFALFACGKAAHWQRFFIASFLALFITILVGTWFPAMGGHVYYDMDMSRLKHLPAIGRIHEETLLTSGASYS